MDDYGDDYTGYGFFTDQDKKMAEQQAQAAQLRDPARQAPQAQQQQQPKLQSQNLPLSGLKTGGFVKGLAEAAPGGKKQGGGGGGMGGMDIMSLLSMFGGG